MAGRSPWTIHFSFMLRLLGFAIAFQASWMLMIAGAWVLSFFGDNMAAHPVEGAVRAVFMILAMCGCSVVSVVAGVLVYKAGKKLHDKATSEGGDGPPR